VCGVMVYVVCMVCMCGVYGVCGVMVSVVCMVFMCGVYGVRDF